MSGLAAAVERASAPTIAAAHSILAAQAHPHPLPQQPGSAADVEMTASPVAEMGTGALLCHVSCSSGEELLGGAAYWDDVGGGALVTAPPTVHLPGACTLLEMLRDVL